MAAYNRTADLAVEAQVLGGDPETWYTAAVADGTILVNKPATGKYLIGVWDGGDNVTSNTGWVELATGDYVISVAAGGGKPKYLKGMKKAAFEALYELDEE